LDPRDFLSRTPPFDRLDPERMRAVERALEIAYAARGETILRRTDASNEFLFVIRKGSTRLERDGRAVQILEEGDPFGYPSLLGGGSPTVDVIAEEDTLLYRLPKKLFDDLLTVPAFGEYFLKELAGRLRGSASGGPSILSGSLADQVSGLVTRPPVSVTPETTIAEAAQTMTLEKVSSILISSEPPGIVTDRDLRRRVLAKGFDPASPVSAVMTHPLRTVAASATLFEALLEMLEQRIHHLPVEQDGRVLGIITDTDLLRHQLKSPLHLLRLLDRLREPEEFRGFASEMFAMVDVLFQGNLDAFEIGRIVATLNDAAAKRVLRSVEQRLGEPPCEYGWIVFGSEGRMEQALLTDQDNALVYAKRSPEAEAYFRELGTGTVAGLAKLGIPPCPGGFMASRWTMPLADWKRQFSEWIDKPRERSLIDAANFFDFRRIAGTLDLEPLDEVIESAGRQDIFLARMAKNAVGFRPPLGLFHRIREKPAGVDLKKGGIIPIVALARLYALALGIRARGTVDRLTRAAGEPDGVSIEGADTLREAFRFLLHLRLAHQLRSHREGRPIDNSVRLEELTALERRHLKDTFVEIAELQQAVAMRYGTNLLS
jgi:CBS domain-containing protein